MSDAHSAAGGLVCFKCQVPLVESKVSFSYLGYNFDTKTPRCPQCRLAFVPEELVKGKIAELETTIEDK